MVTKLSHTSFFVTDQEKAYDFYVNKLGFKVNTDVKMDNGMRWLTLNPPEQPDLEIVLMDASGDGGGMGWEDFMNAARQGNYGGFSGGFGGIDLGDIFGD